MKNLHDTIEEMIDNSQYTEAADYVAQELGVKLIFHGTRFESMQWDKDGQKRYIVDCELKRDKKRTNLNLVPLRQIAVLRSLSGML